MAGISFKEEVLKYGANDSIDLNYSEEMPLLGQLNWAQVFYLMNSAVICKVYNTSIVMEQVFFIVPDNQPEVRLSVDSAKKILIAVPAPIVPSLGLKCDQNTFSLFVATSYERIFKFTFFQGWGFSNSKLKETGGYLLNGVRPKSFALLSYCNEECDACIGLDQSALGLVTLPETQNGEFVTFDKLLESKPSTSILKTLASFVTRVTNNEQTIRIANMKNNILATLSSCGILRIFDTISRTFIGDIDLETGELSDYKFAYFVDTDYKSISVAYLSEKQWWVYSLRLNKSSFEVLSKFTEKGHLKDLQINGQGIWTVWKTEYDQKILFKSHLGNINGVYTLDDDMITQNLEDNIYTNQPNPNKDDIIKRLLIPGRFSKKDLQISLMKIATSPMEEDGCDNQNWLESLSTDQAISLLSAVKTQQILNNEILALCCCDEIGLFPTVVIRGEENLGILREVREEFEGMSLYIQKTALTNYSLIKSGAPEHLSKFKFSCASEGIEKALCLIRLWRMSFCSLLNSKTIPLRTALVKISKEHMPYHLLQLLKKSLPPDIDEVIKDELKVLGGFFELKTERAFVPSTSYWPDFALSFLGISLKSHITAIADYCIDLSLLTLLTYTVLKPFVFRIITEKELHPCIQIAITFNALKRTINSAVGDYEKKTLENENIGNWAGQKMMFNDSGNHGNLEEFSYPVTICSIYARDKSDLVLGDKNLFCLSSINDWVTNFLYLGVRNILVLNDQYNFSTSIISKILAYYGESEILMQYFHDLEYVNSASLYLVSRSYQESKNDELGQKIFIRGGAILESGDYNESYTNFIEGPWDIDIQPDNVNYLSIYNSSFEKITKNSNNKRITLTDFFISSLYADFEDDKTLSIIKKLAAGKNYNEAITILQAQLNKKIVKNCLWDLIDITMQNGDFSMFLQIPLNSLLKEIALAKLQEKASCEQFDLIKIVSSERYFYRAANLFLNEVRTEDRIEYRSDRIPWSQALYMFAMSNQYFCTAAEAMYRYTMEISSFLNALVDNKHESVEDLEFLRLLVKENLLLATLAARNINSDMEKCWFLVSNNNKGFRKMEGSQSSDETPARKYVTLMELEQKVKNILIS